jgi:hypothetical protein
MPSGRKIDDGQAPVNQANAGAGVKPSAKIVWPAMGDNIAHLVEGTLEAVQREATANDASETAHP